MSNEYLPVENHMLRSQYINTLIQDIPENELPRDEAIPQIIVQFWHDLDDIPQDVQVCINSWEVLERQGFKRLLFDEHEAGSFISQELGDEYIAAFRRCHHPAMKCDFFRLCYMLKHGGFYVDADEIYQGIDFGQYFQDRRLKLQPLCYDNSTGEMVSATIFMKCIQPSKDWIFYVNNNPIISPANHPVIQLALDRATKRLLQNQDLLDIQSITGPGNLTASLVHHSITCNLTKKHPDYLIIPNWDELSITPWPLSYREDDRNWRLWKPKEVGN